MKEITFSELKKKKVSEIEAGSCLKVTANCEVIFYAVIKPEQVMKDRVEGICGAIDAGRGK